MKIQKELFGNLKTGAEVYLFTITNDDGSQLQVMNYGAAIVSINVPDKNNVIENVVLRFDSLSQYEKYRHFYGATVGRYGNRIDKGTFNLDGQKYTLVTNDGENHLHGGLLGFDRIVWETEEKLDLGGNSIKFSYLSKDMEEGYPGNLNVSVTYTFSENHEVQIDYQIRTDKKTVKNITNHAYFNLTGNVKSDILGHLLMLNADKYLPVKTGLIPTGMFTDVKDTPMDFLKPHPIGERVNEKFEQLMLGLGYDHNWILNSGEDEMNYAGYVYEPFSGRQMDIYTTEPGIQFYSGNFMDGTFKSNNGVSHDYRHAFCLETQHFPDSPNQNNFPTTVLNPGENYKSKTIYKFSVK
jgi:aldose 1-epimerase